MSVNYAQKGECYRREVGVKRGDNGPLRSDISVKCMQRKGVGAYKYMQRTAIRGSRVSGTGPQEYRSVTSCHPII